MGETGLVIDYRYPPGSNTRIDVPIIAIILIGLTSLTLGLFRISMHADLMDFGKDALAMLLYIFSASILVLACRSLRNKVITESVMMILVAFSTILYTVSSVQNDSRMLSSMALFALGFVACTAIFNSRDEKFFSLISASFAVIILSGVVFYSTIWFVPVGLLIFNGVGLVLSGGFRMIGFHTRTPLGILKEQEVEDEEFPEVLVSTVGVLLFGIMSFSVGIRMIDEGDLLLSFIAFKLFMGLIVLCIGTYAVYHRIVGEGLTMMLVALSSLVYAVSMLVFSDTPHYLDTVIGLILMPVALCLFWRKEYLIGTTSVLLAFVMIVEVFWEGSELIEILIMMVKVVATCFALVTWFTYDLGRKPKFILYLESKLGVTIQ